MTRSGSAARVVVLARLVVAALNAQSATPLTGPANAKVPPEAVKRTPPASVTDAWTFGLFVPPVLASDQMFPSEALVQFIWTDQVRVEVGLFKPSIVRQLLSPEARSLS